MEQFETPRTVLADPRLEESGAHDCGRGDEIRVRAYPYPYVAALTISHDCDSMTIGAFEDWHAFVNGRGATPNGDGLGLEIDDSFWIWSGTKGSFALHQHYPEEEPRIDSPVLGRIAELGRLGWLGSLHSMGNWRPGAERGQMLHASRDQAAYALDRLDRLGIKASVYVNHSGSVSNVGGPWGWYQHADDPDHEFYCLDLMRAYGLKFFWIDVCINFAKFGDHLEFATATELQHAIERFEWAPWLRRLDSDKAVVPIALPQDPARRRRQLFSFFNRTIVPVAARDGSPILAFKRHRGLEQPVMNSFCSQVTEDDLDSLEARRGAVIVYQHFGVFGPRGRSPKLSRLHRRLSKPPVFDEHARARLRDIASRFHSRRLWVATPARVLAYLWLRDSLRFLVEKLDTKWVVTLSHTECASMGVGGVSEGDLNGLTLSVPADAPEIVVLLKGRAQALPVRRAIDPGWPGRHSVHLPWQPLEWPG